MKLFIWKDVAKATYSYHSDGGLVVLAINYEAALEAIRQHQEIPDDCEALTKGPDAMFDVSIASRDTQVYLFPNAGCC